MQVLVYELVQLDRSLIMVQTLADLVNLSYRHGRQFKHQLVRLGIPPKALKRRKPHAYYHYHNFYLRYSLDR